ncbi:MAG: arginyltransferase [Hyphomonadaceae bacterium]|jgi:arginine-tRNA-protein transferase|nr:arginyltransferase [Hyphomonadaceae bacterium]
MSSNPFTPDARIKAARNIRFYLTAPQPCPYLPGRRERKVFTALDGADAVELNDNLTHAGFRRSQNIAYRPACDMCASCVSVRVPVNRFETNRRWRRVNKRNGDVVASLVPAHATYEHFDLLKRYLGSRHAGGGMAEMSAFDYAAMVEETTVRTHLVEYRLDGTDGQLIGCALVDVLEDGLSLVYSFYEPDMEERSLGSFIVLDHIRQAREARLAHIYLGYWIAGSAKMAYKVQFQPLEALGPTGWGDLELA